MKLPKIILSLFTLSLSLNSFAAREHLNCRVDEVLNDNFEEGLGEFGSPDVDDDSEELVVASKNGKIEYIRIGQVHSYATDGIITDKMNGTTRVIDATENDKSLRLQVRLFPSQRGIVLFTESGSTQLEKLATVDCMSVGNVEKANETLSNVKKLSYAIIQKLDKKILNRIESVDIPFELGDGYYDQKAWYLYAVMNPDNLNELQGYIVRAELNYTEGDPVEAYVRFDRNGLRLGEIEQN